MKPTKKFKSFFILALLFVSFFIFTTHVVLAAKGDSCPEGAICLDNKLNADTPQEFIGVIIDAVLGLVGSLALLMFVFGGITWMTSSGSAEKVKKGKDIIVWAAIGLVVVFSAYGLTRVLIAGVTK